MLPALWRGWVSGAYEVPELRGQEALGEGFDGADAEGVVIVSTATVAYQS